MMRRMRTLASALVLLTLVAACGGEGAHPTATSQSATQPTATATGAVATPSSAASATATTAPEPTATATESPTVTAAPTAPPNPTATPTVVTDPVVYNDIIFGDVYTDPYHGPAGPLYAIDADGSDLHPITSAPEGAYESWPAVSPDGTRLAFIRSFDSADQRFVQGGVYVVDLRTGDEQFIVGGRAQVSWSPDGKRLALAWDEQHYGPACCGGWEVFQGSSKIAVVDADGSNLHVLFEPNFSMETGGSTAGSPTWSPDGARLLFLRRDSDYANDSFERTLVVANADGSDMHDVDTGSIDPAEGYTWSPDGETIVFAGEDGQFPYLGLFTVAPDGSRLNRLTTPDVGIDTWPPFAYTPARDEIAFLGYPVNPPVGFNSPSLYVIASDGSGLRQLSPGSDVNGFSYSPDGTMVAITVAIPNSAKPTLILMTSEGTQLGVLEPVGLHWSPDSTRLMGLLSFSLSSSELRVVDVRTGAVSPAMARIRTGEGVIEPFWRPVSDE